jgi:hypothetical protein
MPACSPLPAAATDLSRAHARANARTVSAASHDQGGMRRLLPVAAAGIMMILSAAFGVAHAQGTWSTAQLNVSRFYLAAASVGNVALFAGGGTNVVEGSVVDVYNSATGAWSTARLSVGRNLLAAASVGNVALFAGGSITSAFLCGARKGGGVDGRVCV